MVLWHLRSKRKSTGGKIRRLSKKKKYQRGSDFLEIRIGEKKLKTKRLCGGRERKRPLSMSDVNLADPRTGKITKTRILSVDDNQANVHFVRRNVLTKGALIKTGSGVARITSRPGHSGIVNAVLVKDEK